MIVDGMLKCKKGAEPRWGRNKAPEVGGVARASRGRLVDWQSVHYYHYLYKDRHLLVSTMSISHGVVVRPFCLREAPR